MIIKGSGLNLVKSVNLTVISVNLGPIHLHSYLIMDSVNLIIINSND